MASKYEDLKFSDTIDIGSAREILEDRPDSADLLFESEWDVFVVKRDPATGTFISLTACCEEALAS